MGISNSVKGTQWKTNLFYTKKQFYLLIGIRSSISVTTVLQQWIEKKITNNDS